MMYSPEVKACFQVLVGYQGGRPEQDHSEERANGALRELQRSNEFGTGGSDLELREPRGTQLGLYINPAPER